LRDRYVLGKSPVAAAAFIVESVPPRFVFMDVSRENHLERAADAQFIIDDENGGLLHRVAGTRSVHAEATLAAGSLRPRIS
jgi:hypothetical protein